MKYFTSELWDLINSESEEVRQQAELKWNENSQQYNNYFNCTIKKRLNKKFYNKYITCEGFHDADIKQITISNLNNIKCQVNIFINKNNQKFNIEYINVTGIKYDNINNISVSKYSKLYWGYSEFEAINNKILQHNILFDDGSEMQIYFKKISIL